MHIMEPFFLVEFLDIDTLSREVDEGELAVAVVTPLGRRSFPLIRFNTQDIVKKGSAECSCGRTSVKIEEVAGRADHLTKVRGVLFSPVSVEELVRAEFPEVNEFEIIVQKKGIMDEISLKVEPRGQMGDPVWNDFSARLSERLKIKTNLRFGLERVAEGGLPRYTLKSKRFKDLREERG